ncbi:MAG: amino acid ABC transporter permease [Oscillospiraceae bacterium]|nr:amino acid ABC transporter permease [Oscillospiraceae bacterium]
MEEKPKKNWRAAPGMFFAKHRAGCIAAAALALVALLLVCTRPPMQKLEAAITQEFISDSGKYYTSNVDKANLWVVGVVRGRNVSTGEAETYIGIAGHVFRADHSKILLPVSDILLWTPMLLDGAKVTLSLSITSTALGLFLSVFMALGKISKFKLLSKLCSGYIFFFRGTPLMLQLFFIYYGLPYINPALAIQDKFTAAFIAFSLNSVAYCAEIIRAAIQSIDKGQFEASHALGFSYWQTMRLVVIPQSIRRLIPPVANEFIMVLKDAALVAVIAMMDITRVAQKISSSSASPLVYIPAAILYLVITAFFTFIFNRLEKRFSMHL